MQRFDELDSAWLRTLFDEAPAAMAIVNSDHHFARCNTAFCALVGYARSELVARTWQSITHPDDVDGDNDGAAQLKLDKSRDVYTVAKRYLSKSGGIVWVNLHVRSVWNGDKFVCYYMVALPLAQHGVLAECAPVNPKGLLEWARANPKDAAIIAAAASLFLGRDSLQSLIQFLVSLKS